MKTRCFNPNSQQYYNYGARGITVCKRWLKFENFHADMGDKPDGMSLERINNDGNYEPGNCRWATAKEQQANTRLTVRVTINGETSSLSEWCRRYGLKFHRVWRRIEAGMDPIEAVTRTERLPFGFLKRLRNG